MPLLPSDKIFVLQQFDPGLEYCKTDRPAVGQMPVSSQASSTVQQLAGQQQAQSLPTNKVNSIQGPVNPASKGHFPSSNPNYTQQPPPQCQIMCNMNTAGPFSFI